MDFKAFCSTPFKCSLAHRHKSEECICLRHDGTMPTITLAALRRYAIARSLFTPTTLPKAIER
ncbi:MAG: hypothetical protein C0453_18805, partial [Comamonadaceae bacterium]|nr:hypothetical protein [Comamonadaceae bacterium]